MEVQTAPPAPLTPVLSAPTPAQTPSANASPHAARSTGPLRPGRAARANCITHAFARRILSTTGTARADAGSAHKADCTGNAGAHCTAYPACTNRKDNTRLGPCGRHYGLPHPRRRHRRRTRRFRRRDRRDSPHHQSLGRSREEENLAHQDQGLPQHEQGFAQDDEGATQPHAGRVGEALV